MIAKYSLFTAFQLLRIELFDMQIRGNTVCFLPRKKKKADTQTHMKKAFLCHVPLTKPDGTNAKPHSGKIPRLAPEPRPAHSRAPAEKASALIGDPWFLSSVAPILAPTFFHFFFFRVAVKN